MNFFSQNLNVNPRVERLFFFLMVLLMLCHIGACLWILYPQLFLEDGDGMGKAISWIEALENKDSTNGEIYWHSFYWTVQTITTVGYGEFPAQNTAEQLF
jgi:hypothetical protein